MTRRSLQCALALSVVTALVAFAPARARRAAIQGVVLHFGTDEPVAGASVRAFRRPEEGSGCARPGEADEPVASTDTTDEGWYLLEVPEPAELCVAVARGQLKVFPAPEVILRSFEDPVREERPVYMLDAFAPEPEASGRIVARGIRERTRGFKGTEELRALWDDLFRVGYRTLGKVLVARQLEAGEIGDERDYREFARADPEAVAGLEPLVWRAVASRSLAALPERVEGEWPVPPPVLVDMATSFCLREGWPSGTKAEALEWLGAWEPVDDELLSRAREDLSRGR